MNGFIWAQCLVCPWKRILQLSSSITKDDDSTHVSDWPTITVLMTVPCVPGACTDTDLECICVCLWTRRGLFCRPVLDSCPMHWRHLCCICCAACCKPLLVVPPGVCRLLDKGGCATGAQVCLTAPRPMPRPHHHRYRWPVSVLRGPAVAPH